MNELREILEHLFNSGGAYATGDLLGGKPIEQAEQAIRAWAVNKLPSEEELKEILWDIARIEVNSQASIIIAKAISQRING